MSGGVADNAPLDYARIQLIPSENRFSVFLRFFLKEFI